MSVGNGVSVTMIVATMDLPRWSGGGSGRRKKPLKEKRRKRKEEEDEPVRTIYRHIF